MKPEEKPQEPLKTPCRFCEGRNSLLEFLGVPTKRSEPCPFCHGSGHEEKP